MQVCTQAWGKTASIASGKPARPSTQAIRTSSTPRWRRSLRTASQNLAPSVSCHQIPERFAVAVDADADGQIAGASADRAVLGHLHVQRVEVDDRIDALQRARAPRGDVLQDRVGDAADRVAADLDAVQPLQVRGDVAHRHAAGVEVKHALVQARQPRLALGDQLGIKRALAVARRPHTPPRRARS